MRGRHLAPPVTTTTRTPHVLLVPPRACAAVDGGADGFGLAGPAWQGRQQHVHRPRRLQRDLPVALQLVRRRYVALGGQRADDRSLPRTVVFATGGTIAGSSASNTDTTGYRAGVVGVEALVLGELRCVRPSIVARR